MPQPAPAQRFTVRRLSRATDEEIRGLAELLIDCVEGGASVSFMSPLHTDKAADFWRRASDSAARSERALFIAEDTDGIVGTVQLMLDLPENQPHRADIAKMLVHRRARRQGVGAAVLEAAENLARDLGKTLLVLDTASSDAQRLYSRLGWIKAGVVPGYALLPRGGLCDTTFYYRSIMPRAS